MATVERYSSFEEMDAAQVRDNKVLRSSLKNTKPKENAGKKLFKEFGKLLRKGIIPPPSKK